MQESMVSTSVLLVVSSLAAGGAERTVSELAGNWAASGRRIGVLTFSNPGTDHYALDSRVRRIALGVLGNSASPWQRLTGSLKRQRLLRAAVRRFKPDVVVSFIDRMNVEILVATLGLRVPVIVCERIDPRRHGIGPVWAMARRLLYPMAAGVVVQTEAVARWAHGYVPKHKVHVIPNFVRRLPSGEDVRDARLVLAVGRLDVQKGFDILMQAFAASAARAPGARLVIIGEGPQRSALSVLRDRLGLADHVEMPGVVAAPERWMARAAVFVLPSRYEGFPNVLLEAMAMGCPVVAADCDSGPKEIIMNDVDGILIPPNDPAALADALARLLGDEELRRRLGAAAVAVRERYSAASILKTWESVVFTSCNK